MTKQNETRNEFAAKAFQERQSNGDGGWVDWTLWLLLQLELGNVDVRERG